MALGYRTLGSQAFGSRAFEFQGLGVARRWDFGQGSMWSRGLGLKGSWIMGPWAHKTFGV